MQTKIDNTVICIPPHISTTWDRVSYLHSTEDTTHGLVLVINLIEGKTISIFHLDPAIIQIAFAAHLRYLENHARSHEKNEPETAKPTGDLFQQITQLLPKQLAHFPIRIGIPKEFLGIENLEMAFQHNQEQAHMPDLPADMLEKISSTAKMFFNQELSHFPKPEPHCNCMHCQVGRAIHHGINPHEEPIADEELTFRTWDIQEEGDHLYKVTNPLDPKEQYNVYLGTPVGCTCGQAACEHIQAVLQT